MTYKWKHAHDWLIDKIANAGEDWLEAALKALASVTDADTIQDVFESEMDEDGYFETEKAPGRERPGPVPLTRRRKEFQ